MARRGTLDTAEISGGLEAPKNFRFANLGEGGGLMRGKRRAPWGLLVLFGWGLLGDARQDIS